MRVKDGIIIANAADKIKAELIDFLLDCHDNFDLIANETPFLQSERMADMIAIRNGITMGFEIKSNTDDLRTLSQQLSDYTRVFNAVYLVFSAKFAGSPEIEKLPKTIGLFTVDTDNNLKFRRKAATKVILDKSAMLSLLWRKDLETLAPSKKKADFDDLRDYVLRNCPIKTIQEQIIKSLQSRYGNGYKLMIHERGEKTTIEDLFYITGLKKHQIVFADTSIA
ncbi:MAG: sce7726 family protein [Alphaproteobacteria bacterium]|nr:sce7726 family protein [Alphaproteobacteria bacterium]